MLAATSAATRKRRRSWGRANTPRQRASSLLETSRPHVTTGGAKYPTMRMRITVSILVGVASGMICQFLMVHFHQDAADFRWALHLAQRLLAGQNPYDTPL